MWKWAHRPDCSEADLRVQGLLIKLIWKQEKIDLTVPRNKKMASINEWWLGKPADGWLWKWGKSEELTQYLQVYVLKCQYCDRQWPKQRRNQTVPEESPDWMQNEWKSKLWGKNGKYLHLGSSSNRTWEKVVPVPVLETNSIPGAKGSPELWLAGAAGLWGWPGIPFWRPARKVAGSWKSFTSSRFTTPAISREILIKTYHDIRYQTVRI